MNTHSTDASANRRILLLIAALAFLWTALRSWGYLIDDTFITLRFARNLIEGSGLVFNPGERVEGYTSLALVLLSAPLLALHIDPVLGLGILSGVSAVWTLRLTARLERELVGAEAPRPALSALLLVAASAFAYWSLRAMETLLFTALLISAVSVALREARTGRWRGSGCLFALLSLTRPEGPFVFGVFTAALALAERWQRGDWSHLRRHLANALVVLAVVAIHFAWRWHYYGEVLPNTYYAKVTGGAGQLATGLSYLREFSLANPVLAASLAFPLLLLSRSLRARFAEPALALVIYATLAAYVAYVVVVGADFMPYFRFFVPVLPLCAVLAAGLLRCIPRPAQGPIVLAIFALQAAAGLATEQPYRAFVAHRTAQVGERVGAWLRERLAPDDWIAVNTAGSLPYVSRLPTIDMLGLTDAQIAHRPIYIVSEGWAGHRRGWGEYVLQRRPRVILWYNSAGLAEPHYLSDHELADDPLFRFFYTLRVAVLPPTPDSQADSVLRRYLGFPFGYDPSGASSIPDLGLRLRFRSSPLALTSLLEGPLRVVTFELDARDGELWQDALRLRGDLRGFVDAVAARWGVQDPPTGDPAARAEVEALCAQALQEIEAGDREEAKRILAQAAGLNGRARSALVPQYVANLAVMSGEIFTAVGAQKEALRLDPGSRLYRENLLRLLTLPYERTTAPPDPSARQRHGVFELMWHPSKPSTWVMLVGIAGLLVWSSYAGGVEFVVLERMKLLVIAAAIAVVGCRALRLAGMADRRVYLASLSLIASVAWILYTNFFAFHGIGRERVFIHLHDVAHYYLGAKYFPELGYQRLYTAMLRAEAEKYENHFRSLEARDLETNGLVDIRALLARSDPVKGRFSAERWAAFQEDVGFFRGWMKKQWGEVLRDHGFNPPPLWPLLGGALANLVPAGSHTGILVLTLLDPVLLLAMFASIAWAFGLESMLLASIYFCTISGASFGWTGGGFLRFVWLASLVGAVCCLKRDRFATAGALLGLAAMLRIFPAWFVVPIALHALMDAIQRRQVSPRHVRFLLAFAATCASLFAATLTLPAGLHHWQDFRHNIQRQVESNAYNSIGLNEILSFTGPVKASNADEFARELDWRRETYRVQLAVVVLAIAVWLVRRPRWPDDTGTTVLAVPLLFCTLNLAAYYYAFLILLVLAHAHSPWRIASLFGVELATGVLGMLESNPIVLFFYRNLLVASLLLGLYLGGLPVSWSYQRRRSA